MQKLYSPPHKKEHETKVERIQRKAIKMVLDLKDLTYEKRLKEIKLTAFEKRTERRD